MTDWQYFWCLASDIGSAFTFWPVTAPLVLYLVGAVVAVLAADRRPWRLLRSLALFGLPAHVTPFCLLVIGVVFSYEGDAAYADRAADASPVGMALVPVLFFGQFPAAGLAAWLSGRDWPAVVGVWALGGWASLPAAFLAGMSVSGQWL